MKYTIILVLFYIITFQIIAGFSACEAQTPSNNRKLDSLRLDSLIKSIPDSVKKQLRASFKKSEDNWKKYNSPEAAKSKIVFEDNMAKALDLKLVVRDTDFKYSQLYIFRDTLFGLYSNLFQGKMYREDFIQNLADTSHLVEFNSEGLPDNNSIPLDCYRNGCVYFRYGNTMKSLCSDGKITEYFPAYQDKLNYNGGVVNYTGKVILYKNQAILIRNKDISAFNLYSQRLIWKYDIPYNANVYSLLRGDTLFFATFIHKDATVAAYDIKTQSVIWKKKFKEEIPRYSHNIYEPEYLLFQDGNNLVFPTGSTCYTLAMNTGNVTGKVTLSSFFGNQGKFVVFRVKNNQLFIDAFANNEDIIKCIDFATDKTIWEIKDACLMDLYKKYIIAYTSDRQYYLIIGQATGAIINKITAPVSNNTNIDFIGNYILMNRDAIYK